MRALRDITVPKVEQLGPADSGEFIYVDISSIDAERKRIVDPKRMQASEAPSRAKQRLRKGDVLVSMTRPNRNAVAIVPPELDGAIGSTGFHVLRAVDDVEPRWIFNAVQTKDFISAMEGLVQGALYPAVRPKDVQSFAIPLPPLESQIEAVAEIEKQFSRLDEAVANLKRVKANLKRYKAAVLKAAVEGRLVPTEAELARKEGRDYETGEQLLQRILETRRKEWKGKGKYTEPAAPDMADLPALPDGWLWASVDQLAEVVRGASPRPAGDPKYFGGDIPWITVGTVTSAEGKFVRAAKETLTTLGKENSRFIEAGTLLLTNSGATLGVPKISAIGGCINDGVAALFVHNESIKLYLLHVFDSLTESLRRINQGAAQPNLNTAIIRGIKVALPPEAELQRLLDEVDRRVSIVQGIEGQVDLNLARAERMRQSVLAKMFGGGT
ncbi:MAG: restriction endonuclease subunit S [Rhodocyclaceae bacterium]|nr:restriction endonuclease subunit S [Rhodocyclaceae bacterium]MCA3022366.1 restriction endonuclease subunit S [Rhodocyclaceae bacterium]